MATSAATSTSDRDNTTAMRFLLDTNVLSELVKREPAPRVVDWVAGQSPLDLAISVLTLGEIVKGVGGLAPGRHRDLLQRWSAREVPRQFAGRVLDIDARVASRWGELAAAARRDGHALPMLDGLLLASAAVHDLVFVTRNERDCANRGVDVHNPWA